MRERESAPAALEATRSSARLPVARRDDHHEVEARGAAGLPRPAGVERGPASVPADLVRPRGAGAPLPAERKAAMEAAFGADLSGVRIHTGAGADRTARALGASAYTVGPSIVFADGAYAPTTPAGEALLVHEVAHAVQDPAGRAVHRYDNVCEPEDPTVLACEMVPAPAEAEAEEPAPDPRAAAAAAAQALTDDALRARMTETRADVARGDAVALERHDLYRYELARRQLSEPIPTPSAQYFQTADGLVWSLSAEHSRWQVERIYAGQATVGPDEARDNLRAAVQAIAVANGFSPIAGTPEPGALTQDQLDAVRVAIEIRELAERQFTQVQTEVESFMATFEPNTLALAYSILDASEQRIRQELVHYGVVMTEAPVDVDDDLDADVDEGGADLGGPGFGFRDDAASQDARAGLQRAAGELAASETIRRAVAERYAAIDWRIRQIEECRDPEQLRRDDDFDADFDEGPPADPVATYCAGAVATDSEMELLVDTRAALDRLLAQAVRELAELRASREDQFPLLASYTSGAQIDLDGLHRLATSVDASAIAWDAEDKLANIARVRSKLRSGDLSIWELPELLSIAQQRGQVAPISPYANAIHDRVVAAGDRGFWRSIAITVLSIGLGLLAAIPTGGASLAVTVTVLGAEVAGAVLDVYLLAESVSDYRTRAALTNTDYDRARALSRDEPSLFWLAVDIVGTVVGVGSAVRGATHAFRDIARARRVALTARRAEEVLEQLARMQELRAELGLAANVGERLELQILSELPDRQLAEAVAGATTTASGAADVAARVGRRLTERVSPDDLAPLSRELGLPVAIDSALSHDVRVMTELVDGRVVRPRQIVVGADATVGDVVQHRETIRLLGELERVTASLGARTDELLGTIVGSAGGINPFPAGSQAFNSWVELRKYPELLQSRHARIAEDGVTAAERGAIRDEIRFFETELAHHRLVVDAAVVERGEDFIARAAASNDAAFTAGYPREFTLAATDGAPARTFTVGEPGSPYYYARAGDGTDRYVLRRYVDAVDAPSVTVTRSVDGAVQIVEGGLTRAEAGLALRRSWPQPLQDAFVNAEATLRARHGAALYRVVPLAGVHRMQQTVGALIGPTRLEELREILFKSLSRNRSADVAGRIADEAIRDLTAHSIVVVRGTDQLRAFGYRPHFVDAAGELVDGDLHHLVPLYLGGDHRIRNLLDLDPAAHRRVHVLLEGVVVEDGFTLSPNSIGRIDADFEAGIGILYRDGRVELAELSSYTTSAPASAADVVAPVSSSAAP